MRIPFTNIELNLRKSNSNMIEIDKNVLAQFIDTGSKFSGGGQRPMLDREKQVGDDEILVPITPIPLEIVGDIAKYSDVLRTIHQNLRKEIFRKGYTIKENFASKCRDCGKEFPSTVEECDECGSANIREPDVEQKKLLTKILKNVNDNGQNITKVYEELNDDLETYDDAYVLCIQDYFYNEQGELLYSVPVEILRMDPKYVRLVADKQGRPGRNQNGDSLFVCPEHRYEIQFNKETCRHCDRNLMPAHYRSETPDGKYIYYGRDEVYHTSKYNPSLTYGFSVIYAIWMKVVTLMNMDAYMKAYYSKQRPPRGLLFVNTPNMQSLTKAWNWMLDQWKKNPHQIPPIGVEQTAGSKGSLVNFIDMMKTPDEMQYTEMRDEMSRKIGAVYGVMPLYQADVSTSGGLNNEGLQITVTNRAIMDGQGVYNGDISPWICKRFNVTDYSIFMEPNEEQDMIHIEELKAKKIANAQQMQQMGFEITLTDDGEFEYDPIDEPVQAPQQGGDLAGLFGGMGQNDQGQRSRLPDQQKPEVGSFNDGEPSRVRYEGAPAQSPYSKKLSKGRTYLREGQEPPKGASVQTGPGGGRYYENTSSGSSRRGLMNKPIEDMSNEELQIMQDWMDESKFQYTGEDLESAKRFLQSHPNLRQRYGKNYYEFAVQVAEAINRGEDPYTIDWASLDSTIPLRESLWGERYGEAPAQKSLNKEDSAVTTETSGVSNPRHDKRRKHLKEYLKSILQDITKEKTEQEELKKANPDDLRRYIEDNLYSRTFDGVGKTKSDLIKDFILRSIVKGYNKERVMSYLEKKGIPKHQSQNIFRTETQALRTKVREWSYKRLDPEDQFKYKWIGPTDHRTTKTCKNIENRTKNGVSMKKLRNIIDDEVQKAKERGELPNNYESRDYTPHFMCRHTFVRVFE